MSKIIQAVNAMISDSDKIGLVIKGSSDNEYFFIFDKQYKWSLFFDSEDYYLKYFPGNSSLESIANNSDAYNSVLYSTSKINTKEARESFNELYTIVQEKLYGVDKVLDDIISSSTDFPIF